MPRKQRPVKDIVDDVERVRRSAEGTPDQVQLLHELHVYQEELLVQNQELVAAQQMLEETRDRFVDLYEFAPNGYLTLDENGIVLQVNLTGASLLGRSKQRIEKLPFVGLCVAQSRPTFLDFMRRCRSAKAGTSVTTQLTIASGDGPLEVEFHCRWRDDRPDHPREFLTALVDITSRRTLERERETAAREHAALASRLLSAQDDERYRMARDLHDDVGQQLTALRLKLEAAAAADVMPDGFANHVKAAQQMVDTLDRRLHFMASELRPSALDLSLVVALDQYVNQWSTMFGISGHFQAIGVDRARFSPEVETHIYRVAQEALNNIYKHSDASNVSVIFERRRDDLVLIVEDDGKGFDVRKPLGERALGLLGMRERAHLIGGRVDIESSHGRGTSVFLIIPSASAEKVG